MKIASAILPTKYGIFKIIVFKSKRDNLEHIALVKGENFKEPVLVRIHSQCLTGDIFNSLKCDCGDQLKKSLITIGKNNGVLIYLNQEGRGLGLNNKIKAYSLQETGLDTVDANNHLGLPTDTRNYRIGAEILKNLKITTINLLTNNPDKIEQLKKYGININKRVPLEIIPNHINESYLRTKKNKLGHKLKQV